MGNPILNRQTVLLCPHGGVVTHVPMTVTSYRVNGYPPLLMTDQYIITGCPSSIGGMPAGCLHVQWLTASTLLYVKGAPVLTSASVGLCNSSMGFDAGPVMIAAVQTAVLEPDTATHINQ